MCIRDSNQGIDVAKITKSFQYGGKTVTLETGEVARQAGGAVLVSCEGTVVLATAVAAKSAREGQDFFPLTVDYQEKFYAGGRIPGGFFKREAVSYTHLDVYKRQIYKSLSLMITFLPNLNLASW